MTIESVYALIVAQSVAISVERVVPDMVVQSSGLILYVLILVPLAPPKKQSRPSLFDLKQPPSY